MARENTVMLFGRVAKARIVTDDDHNYVSGMLWVDTARRTHGSDLNNRHFGDVRFDRPCVYSRNPSVIEHGIKGVEEGDLVFVKGSLSTHDVVRSYICPNCGKESQKPAVIIIVDPLHVFVVQKNLPKEELVPYLKKHSEIGNQIFLDGTLCREPNTLVNAQTSDLYTDENGITRFQFQVASNRIRYIVEDGEEKKTDYPWVKCYGEKANIYAQNLHLNSSVFIDGAVQTRQISKSYTCDYCGAETKKNAIVTEIVPYHIEYLQNCGTEFAPVNIDEFDAKEELFFAEPEQ